MAADETERKKAVAWECLNPRGKPYSLGEIVALLQTDKTFAQFFFELLKRAEAGHPDANDCLNSYLEPTDRELQDLGVPESRWSTLRKCTDSGLLVAVIAQQNA